MVVVIRLGLVGDFFMCVFFYWYFFDNRVNNDQRYDSRIEHVFCDKKLSRMYLAYFGLSAGTI